MGICYFTYQLHRPYSLGDSDKLQYIGKVDYGCLLICDSEPASTYYYATDMNMNEVFAYFKKASVIQAPQTIGNKVYFAVKLASQGTYYGDFYLDKTSEYSEHPFLKKTTKRHLFTVPSFKYDGFKDSL